jgi:hypothetical protein
MTNNNDQEQIVDSGKPEYDGSKRPMLLVKNYKTRQAIENAKVRIDKRFAWVKARVGQISAEYNNSETSSLAKQDLLHENNMLAEEMPKLRISEENLIEKFTELENEARDNLDGLTLEVVDCN